VKIRDLPLTNERGEPTRFKYEYGRTATLLRLGPGGATIRYDNAQREVQFEVKSGDEVTGEVAFTAPGKPVQVSDYSDVEVL
jgi:hypothetical protein